MAFFQHIAVAIADPTAKRQMAIHKAGQLAQRSHARLTLFHAFSLPYPLPTPAPVQGAEALRAATEHRLAALEKLAKPLRKTGIEVACKVVWDFPVFDAINRFVLKHKPDLLVAESHRHGVLGRMLLANTDWELIRSCPCPLWFVKTRNLREQPAVLVAVDPLHGHAKPSQLDDRLISTALHLTEVMGGNVSLVHAYHAPATSSPATFMEPIRIPVAPERARKFVAGIEKLVHELARKHGIPGVRCLTREGDATGVLNELVAKTKADLLVLGAVSRSALQRPFIGNTAERVIDKVQCDLLIVKPAGFKLKLPRKTAGELLKL